MAIRNLFECFELDPVYLVQHYPFSSTYECRDFLFAETCVQTDLWSSGLEASSLACLKPSNGENLSLVVPTLKSPARDGIRFRWMNWAISVFRSQAFEAGLVRLSVTRSRGLDP